MKRQTLTTYLSLVVVVLHLLLAFTVRIEADDYCYATGIIEEDRYTMRYPSKWVDYIAKQYASFDGGFAGVLIWIIGSPYMPLSTIVFTLALVVSLYFALKLFVKPVVALQLTSLFLIVRLALTYETGYNETFLWFSGAVPYLVPMILFTWLSYWVIQRKPPVPIFALAFFAGGFSATTTMVVGILLAIAAIAVADWRRPLLVALAGTVLAFIVISFAPASSTRDVGVIMSTPPDLLRALGSTVNSFVIYSREHLRHVLLALPALTLALALAVQHDLHVPKRLIWTFGIGTLLIYFLSTYLGFYTQGWFLPARARLSVVLIASVFLFLWGTTLPKNQWAQQLANYVSFAVLVGAICLVYWQFWEGVQYAQAWDERAAYIQAHARPDAILTVDAVPHREYSLTPDPAIWRTACMAEWWGVAELRVSP